MFQSDEEEDVTLFLVGLKEKFNYDCLKDIDEMISDHFESEED